MKVRCRIFSQFLFLAGSGLFFVSLHASQEFPEEKEEVSRVITGTITSSDQVRLPGAEVRIKDGEQIAISDDEGRYRLLEVPLGKVVLLVPCPGFAEKEVVVPRGGGAQSRVDVTLEVEKLSFEVTVRPDISEVMRASENIGTLEVLPTQMAPLPSLGEKDLFRGLQLLPTRTGC